MEQGALHCAEVEGVVGVVVVELPGEEERLEAIGGLEEARVEVEEVDSAPAAAAVAQEMQISHDQQADFADGAHNLCAGRCGARDRIRHVA